MLTVKPPQSSAPSPEFNIDTYLSQKITQVSIFTKKNNNNQIEYDSNPEIKSNQLLMAEAILKESVEFLIYKLKEAPDKNQAQIKKFIISFSSKTNLPDQLRDKFLEILNDYVGYYSRRENFIKSLTPNELSRKIDDLALRSMTAETQFTAESELRSKEIIFDKFGLVVKVNDVSKINFVAEGFCSFLQISPTQQLPVIFINKSYGNLEKYSEILSHERRHQLNYFYNRRNRLNFLDNYVNEDNFNGYINLFQSYNPQSSQEIQETKDSIEYLKSLKNNFLLIKDKISRAKNEKEYKEILLDFYSKKISRINNYSFKDELTAQIESYTPKDNNLIEFLAGVGNRDSHENYKFWEMFLDKTSFFNNKFDPNGDIALSIRKDLFKKYNTKKFDPSTNLIKGTNSASLILDILRNFPNQKKTLVNVISITPIESLEPKLKFMLENLRRSSVR